MDNDDRTTGYYDTALDRASRDWDGEEPWIDAVCRAAGPGMAVIHDGEAVVAIGVSPLAYEVAP